LTALRRIVSQLVDRADAFLPLGGAAVLVAGWYLIWRLNLIDAVLLPSPLEVADSIWTGVLSGSFLLDFVITIRRTLISFFFAVAIGVPLGVILGSSYRVYRFFEFAVDFFR
jgi:NitT/TauT family transport system permease protein